jgi:Zn-dependent protease with chaperone function
MTPTAGSHLTPGEAVAQRTITAYTLTPEQLRKAEALHRTALTLSLSSTLLTLAVLAVTVCFRIGPRLARAAERLSRRRFVQACFVAPALLLVLFLLDLPIAACGHAVYCRYGLSVQGWRSWFADQLRSELLLVLLAVLVFWGLCAIIRRKRRWWFYAWLASLPVMAALTFAAPVLIDPLFNRFEPLAKSNPELATELQSMARSAGLNIPSSRIFLMRASDKVTTYNAYVTGFGATKRIVVWDNTARDLTLPQTLFVFGHELGHYVLHHILLGLLFTALLFFAGLWLLQRLTEGALRRFGAQWQIAGTGEWSSLPLILLLASLLSFFSEPVASAFSRWEEHQADVFGLKMITPLTGNPSQVAAQTFQLLGERSYSVPDPSPLLVFWEYSHPTTAERVRFVLNQHLGANEVTKGTR